MDYIRWIMFGLGALIGAGLVLLSYSTGSGPPACDGLGDCFLKAQTFVAGLLAIGAASIAYVSARYKEDREDARREQQSRSKMRSTTIMLASMVKEDGVFVWATAQHIERYGAAGKEFSVALPLEMYGGLELANDLRILIASLDDASLARDVMWALDSTRGIWNIMKNWDKELGNKVQLNGQDYDEFIEMLQGLANDFEDLRNRLEDYAANLAQ